MKAVIELLSVHHVGFAVYWFTGSKISNIDQRRDDFEWCLLDFKLQFMCIFFLLAHDCNGSFSHIDDARMNVQRFVSSMLILVLDMASRGAFRSKDAISKLEEFLLVR